MKNKKSTIIICIVIIVIIFIVFWLYSNTGLKGFENEISNFILPENIEKITIKSGIGDSGGNGDYSTYRVVLIVKTEMSIDELNQEFENRKLTSSSHIVNSGTPICYITHCEDTIFKSQRNFTLSFDELEKVEDFTDYYFIEFIK
ncbi:MAG: hypothetical protein HFJ60_04285 [Clostridia bacterium]|jgi:hypothetical protein|nr:hypothetical protein [Clostridia bacterium]